MTKILFLAANPSDTTRLQVGREQRVIHDALRSAEFRHFELESLFATRSDDLSSLLLEHKPDIVHFSGHGSAYNEIVLENDTGETRAVSGDALRRLFRVLKDNVRCVVLNACYSETQAEAIAQEIDCVIGMSDEIADESAISFSKSFYNALGYGRNLQTAFDLACTQIELDGQSGSDIPKMYSVKTDPASITFEKPNKIEQASSQEPNQESHAPTSFERISAVIAAAACLGVLSFLLIRGEPFADPTLAAIARTFMSLAAAIFGASIPGFLRVGWSGGGLAIRAGGALALFVLTYFGTPHVVPNSPPLSPPKVNLEVPNVVDIRSFHGPTIEYDQMLEDDAIVIVRMTYANQEQPARNAFLSQEAVKISMGDFMHNFRWQYFVNIFPGAGCWPCIKESVSTLDIPSGQAVAHETLFQSSTELTWQSFIDEFVGSTVDQAVFSLKVTIDGQDMTVDCQVIDLGHWRQSVVDWMNNNGNTYPDRLILPCVKS